MFIKSVEQNEKRKYLLVVLALRQTKLQICVTEITTFLQFFLQISRNNLQSRETICIMSFKRRLLNYKHTFLCFDKTWTVFIFYYICRDRTLNTEH